MVKKKSDIERAIRKHQDPHLSKINKWKKFQGLKVIHTKIVNLTSHYKKSKYLNNEVQYFHLSNLERSRK